MVSFRSIEADLETHRIDATLTPSERSARLTALKLFRAGECEQLRDDFFETFGTEIFYGMSMGACREIAENNAQRARREGYQNDYNLAISELRCEAAQELIDQHGIQATGLSECFERMELNNLIADLNLSLDEDRCEDAQILSERTGLQEEDVRECFTVLRQKNLMADLSIAEAQGDCDRVAILQEALELTGGEARCRFGVAMASETSRQMFLAAGQYDANDDRARAKLLYSEIVTRFPEDDLALQSVSRLTALNDLERSEQAQREMEVEISRLKGEAEEAQRRAEEAKRQAELARADAQRRAASSVCDGIYAGQALPYRFFLGNVIVLGVDPGRGVASLRSDFSGNSEWSCQNIKNEWFK